MRRTNGRQRRNIAGIPLHKIVGISFFIMSIAVYLRVEKEISVIDLDQPSLKKLMLSLAAVSSLSLIAILGLAFAVNHPALDELADFLQDCGTRSRDEYRLYHTEMGRDLLDGVEERYPNGETNMDYYHRAHRGR